MYWIFIQISDSLGIKLVRVSSAGPGHHARLEENINYNIIYNIWNPYRIS
jgi:hypothetical protein